MDIPEYIYAQNRDIHDYWSNWKYTGLSGHGLWSFAKDLAGRAGTNIDRLGDVVGLTPDDKAEMALVASSVPFLGDVVRADSQWNQTMDRLNNAGLTPSDIRYPGLNGTGNSAGSALNYVSSNILRLYR